MTLSGETAPAATESVDIASLPLVPVSLRSTKAMVELVLTLFGRLDDTGHKLQEIGDVVRFPLPRLPWPLRYLPNLVIDTWTLEWIMIQSPALIKELYTMPGDVLDHEVSKMFLRPVLGGRTPFLLSGRDHVTVRQALVPELTAAAVERYRYTSIEVLDRMIDELPVGSEIQLQDLYTAFSQEVILRVTFGETDQAELDRMRHWMSRCMEHSYAGMRRFFNGLIFLSATQPWKDRADDIPRFPFRAAHKLRREADGILYDKIAQLRANPNDSIASRLIERSRHSSFWTDKVLRDTIATVLIAGHDTSISAYSWATEFLLRNDHARQMLVDEARTATTDAYARACSNEALRLKPPVWGPMSVPRQDIALGSYRVRKGTFIFPSGRAVHADPTAYPDPLEFMPERFLEHTPDRCAFIAFSVGRHRCPGTKFFGLEAGIVLHRVFGRLNLRPVSSDLDRTHMAFGFFNRPHLGVPAVVTARRPAHEVPVYQPPESAPTTSGDTDDPNIDEAAQLSAASRAPACRVTAEPRR